MKRPCILLENSTPGSYQIGIVRTVAGVAVELKTPGIFPGVYFPGNGSVVWKGLLWAIDILSFPRSHPAHHTYKQTERKHNNARPGITRRPQKPCLQRPWSWPWCPFKSFPLTLRFSNGSVFLQTENGLALSKMKLQACGAMLEPHKMVPILLIPFSGGRWFESRSSKYSFVQPQNH